MRIYTDDDYSAMEKEEILAELTRINELSLSDLNLPKEELVERLKNLQRSRHFMCWHDGATLASHGYILMTFSEVYNSAIHFLDHELPEKLQHVNIQVCVEKPNLYLIARCPATDQQLLYSSLRLADIVEMKTPVKTSNNINLTDKIRFFKGDSPARLFEAGQQKGGTYFCCVCPLNANYSGKYTHIIKLPFLDIKDRIKKVTKTPSSISRLKQNKTNLYQNLKKNEIITELRQRDIKCYESLPVKDLRAMLEEEVHGIQRLPALLFGENDLSVEQCNLNCYEILAHEPLHDIMNYIKNLYEELPLHLPKEKKENLRETISCSFNGKEAKNGSDYRKSLMYVTTWSMKHLTNHFVTNLFLTLAELQEITYLLENERSMQKIFRLTNLIFRHMLLIHIHIRGKLLSLTPRKFFGVYFHAIVKHAPIQFRIVSGRTANTEKEEAMFTSIKTDTKLTSNFHPEHLISNIIIRSQARKMLDGDTVCMKEQKSYLHDIYQPIKTSLSNSVISYGWIRKYFSEYQSLLEQQADFLLETKVWWKEDEGGIVFLDHSDAPKESNLKPHHWRSYSIKDEKQYLSECWESCKLDMHNLIPAYKIKICISGEYQIVKLDTLEYFRHENASVEKNMVDEKAKENDSSLTELPEITESDFLENTENTDHSFDEMKDKNNIPDFTVTPLQTKTQTTNLSHCKNKPPFNCFKEVITSTPKPEKFKFQVMQEKCKSVEEPIITQLNPIKCPPPEISENSGYSKSSKLLLFLFGKLEVIDKYDALRKTLKKNKEKINKTKQHEYKTICAQLEVKIKLHEEQLHNELNNTEVEKLSENETDTNDEKMIQRKLQYITQLKKDLHIS